MSAEIIQVSTPTLTLPLTNTRRRTKLPKATMTIHNTPDDLIGPPPLNPPPWMHGSVHTHMQRDREGTEEMVF